VHLETTAIAEVVPEGVRTTDGTLHELDVLVLATGFQVLEGDSIPTFELRGRDGTLAEFWETRRLQAYQGVSVPGFPNFFTVFGPYGYNGSSYFALIEAQVHHIVRCLRRARRVGAERVEVTEEANRRYFEEMLRRRGNQVFWQESCTRANSYYFDKHGDVALRPTLTLESVLASRRFPLQDYEFSAG
jgi:cation diffusion facilitator CzcD-associated flavoprotein CzcO